MSTGNVISDNRHIISDVYSGSGYSLVGEYFTKSWTGQDRAFKGDVTPHPYIKHTSQSYAGTVHFPNGKTASVITGYGWGVEPPLYWDDNDTIKLVVKLGNKIRSTEFSASIFLAEADQSLALVGETATRLAKFFGSLKSGNLYKASSFLAGGDKITRRDKMYRSMKKHFKNRSAYDDRTALANAVLEVQYGWRPLIEDARGLGESIAAVLSRPPKVRYKVRRKIQARGQVANGGNVWNSRKTISKQILAFVSAQPTWRDVLRLEDMGRVVTNRTPWFFVANWFLPFEDYMEARSTLTDLNVTQLILTTKVHSTGVFSGDYGSEASRKEFTFQREILTNSGNGAMFANEFLNTPSFKPIEKSLGWEHMLNGIALLNGTVKRYRD
jgi:hypothetical protein